MEFYSLVFLGERNKKKLLEEIASKLKLSTSSFQVIFLTNTTPKKDNFNNIDKYLKFKTFVFDNYATNEEMFETLVQRENLGSVILFKESAVNINFNDVNKIIEQNSHKNMLVVSKQNKSDNIFFKIFHYIKDFFTHLFLGIHLYDGEADIILLDKLLVSIMNEIPGKSAALTKINGWSGVEPKYVKIDEQPKIKSKISIRLLTPVIVISLLLILSIVGDILISVLNVSIPFLALFFFILVQIALCILLCYTITKTLFKFKFGNIVYVQEANIREVINNFDE